MLRPRPPAIVLLLLGLAPASGAQDRLAARALPPPTVSLTRNACGLHVEDGTLWGLGPDYKARFLDDRVEFTPALGASAPRNLPLSLRYLGATRHGGKRATPIAATRSFDGLHVRYRRGEVTERYEVRPEGIEQSFVFERLPDGDGDLVVRAAVTTELEPQLPADGGALQFLSPGSGGVCIGAVTGIDSNGNRAAGALRFADGVLELSLPAAFVATAALPLVLDPLLGTTVTVGSGNDEREPDVACMSDSSNPRYLVVWARAFSSGDIDLRGQRLESDGTLLGNLINIRTSSTLFSDQPRVAPVKLRNRYVVVWREIVGTSPGTIAACSVDAATGAVSTATQLVAGTDAFANPDVGGDNAGLGDNAVAVWFDATVGRIEGARITVSATGAVTSSGRQILSGAGTNYRSAPSIAQDCGEHGRLLIAWQSSNLGIWLEGRVVTPNLSTLQSLALTTASGPWESAPDVSGDGMHWVVAYDRRLDGSSPPDIYGRWVTFEPATGTCYLGTEQLVDGGSGAETGASVAFLSHSLLVAFRQTGTTVSGGFVRSLDQFSCGPCEGFFTLESTGTRDVRRVASTGLFRSGCLVWESVDPGSGIGEIRARRFSEGTGQAGGFTGSACGPDVDVYGGCPRPGNLGFSLRLEHAEPGRPVFILLRPGNGLPIPDLNCGSGCGFLDPFRAWFFPVGVTDVHGNAAVPLPIPATTPTQGLNFQFGIVPAGAAACPALGASFSRMGIVSIFGT